MVLVPRDVRTGEKGGRRALDVRALEALRDAPLGAMGTWDGWRRVLCDGIPPRFLTPLVLGSVRFTLYRALILTRFFCILCGQWGSGRMWSPTSKGGQERFLTLRQPATGFWRRRNVRKETRRRKESLANSLPLPLRDGRREFGVLATSRMGMRTRGGANPTLSTCASKSYRSSPDS